MAQIPFEHKGCNGWAIYESQYIDSDNARNMHVVEGTITSEGGNVYFTPNAMLQTVCNRQKLKGGKKQNSFCSTDASKIRSKLAEFQNQGYEVCGTCVSHFYADPE